MHDQIDAEWRGGIAGSLADFGEPFPIALRAALIERGEAAHHAGLAGFHHQIGAGDQEHGGGNHRQGDSALKQGGDGHRQSFKRGCPSLPGPGQGRKAITLLHPGAKQA